MSKRDFGGCPSFLGRPTLPQPGLFFERLGRPRPGFSEFSGPLLKLFCDFSLAWGAIGVVGLDRLRVRGGSGSTCAAFAKALTMGRSCRKGLRRRERLWTGRQSGERKYIYFKLSQGFKTQLGPGIPPHEVSLLAPLFSHRTSRPEAPPRLALPIYCVQQGNGQDWEEKQRKSEHESAAFTL